MKLYCELTIGTHCRRPQARPHITSCWKSWENISHGLRIGFMCHRCEQPLRVVRPAHRLGDLAGRSPGSRVGACRPAFPVSQWPTRTKARRLQLRGQPRYRLHCAANPCSLLPPRSDPRNQHGAKNSPPGCERQDRIDVRGGWRRAITAAVARSLQKSRKNPGCCARATEQRSRACHSGEDRLAGPGGDPWTPQAGCRDPSRLRILPATRYSDCQYKTGEGADFAATAPQWRKACSPSQRRRKFAQRPSRSVRSRTEPRRVTIGRDA